MRYLTGIYALNVDDPDGTPGDWHAAALDWREIPMARSDASAFGDWGIRRQALAGVGEVAVASHVRACLDLLEAGAFGVAQGMRDAFICDDSLTPVIFEKALLLRGKANWPQVDEFMGREYGCDWLGFREAAGVAEPAGTVSTCGEANPRLMCVLGEVVGHLNSHEDCPFVLKGGFALARLHGLDRVVTGLRFDAPGRATPRRLLPERLGEFCAAAGYSFQIDEAGGVQRALLCCGTAVPPLRVEVSYRRADIPDEAVELADGVKVYRLGRLAELKAAGYSSRGDVRDLYDLAFICTRLLGRLGPDAVNAVRDALTYTDRGRVEYMLRAQAAVSVDADKLRGMLPRAFAALGLAYGGVGA